jgi:hypothetical protein
MDVERIDYYREKLDRLRDTSMTSEVIKLMDRLLEEIDSEWVDFMATEGR